MKRTLSFWLTGLLMGGLSSALEPQSSNKLQLNNVLETLLNSVTKNHILNRDKLCGKGTFWRTTARSQKGDAYCKQENDCLFLFSACLPFDFRKGQKNIWDPYEFSKSHCAQQCQKLLTEMTVKKPAVHPLFSFFSFMNRPLKDSSDDKRFERSDVERSNVEKSVTQVNESSCIDKNYRKSFCPELSRRYWHLLKDYKDFIKEDQEEKLEEYFFGARNLFPKIQIKDELTSKKQKSRSQSIQIDNKKQITTLNNKDQITTLNPFSLIETSSCQNIKRDGQIITCFSQWLKESKPPQKSERSEELCTIINNNEKKYKYQYQQREGIFLEELKEVGRCQL